MLASERCLALDWRLSIPQAPPDLGEQREKAGALGYLRPRGPLAAQGGPGGGWGPVVWALAEGWAGRACGCGRGS